ncbi:MAG: hypothetical protein ACREUW_05730 [Burkholderiales bacterium]
MTATPFILFVITFCLLCPPCAHAQKIQTSRAAAIEVLDGSASLLSREFVGQSCTVKPRIALPEAHEVRIGDTIGVEGYSFKVGLIEVDTHLDDITFNDQVIAKAGDVVCLLAAGEKSWPYAFTCNALWVRVGKCRPLE